MIPIISENNNDSNVVSDSDSDNNNDNVKENVFDKNIRDKVKVTPKTTINANVVCAIKKLQTSYNDNADTIVKQAVQEKSAIKNSNFLIDVAMVSYDTKQTLKESQMFNKAWNHPKKDSLRKWQDTIHKELADMIKQQVWQKTIKSLFPLIAGS